MEEKKLDLSTQQVPLTPGKGLSCGLLPNLNDDISALKNKLRNQDGKLYLLAAQLEKLKEQQQRSSEELSQTKQDLQCKSEENAKLVEDTYIYRGKIRVAEGKIHLLQYQLVKSQQDRLNQQNSKAVDASVLLSTILLHYSRYSKVLRAIESQPKLKSRNTYSVNFSELPQSIIKAPVDQSLTVSRLLPNYSMESDESNLDLSNYSLNTTLQQSYHRVEEQQPQSFIHTPKLASKVKKSSGVPLQSSVTKKLLGLSPIKTSKRLNEIVLGGETQRNLQELRHSINQESFSIFSSPVTFKENISRIRVENERLRNDIFRFRGKLEGMKSELQLMRSNVVN